MLFVMSVKQNGVNILMIIFFNKYQSEEVKKKEKNAEKLKEDLEI